VKIIAEAAYHHHNEEQGVQLQEQELVVEAAAQGYE
jgi:hypothetical protein